MTGTREDAKASKTLSGVRCRQETNLCRQGSPCFHLRLFSEKVLMGKVGCVWLMGINPALKCFQASWNKASFTRKSKEELMLFCYICYVCVGNANLSNFEVLHIDIDSRAKS